MRTKQDYLRAKRTVALRNTVNIIGFIAFFLLLGASVTLAVKAIINL